MTLEITQILDTAVQQARSLADRRAESYALGTLGKLYEKIKDESKAIKFTQSALAITETILAPEIVYQWQWQMGRILQTQAEEKLHKQVVHIATHGKFSSNPQQTFILDWNKRITVKDWDTFLRVKNQKIVSPVKLLVLSACETAIGDKRAALGLAGVAVRAGASSTVATLWQVNDASTARFMIQFYQQLQNPQITKAEALRNVQLAILNEDSDKDYNRPYHWAPFILVGNWL